MAEIKLTIPDLQISRVTNAMAARHGWTSGSGLTKAQFAKQHIIEMVMDDVRWFEGQNATESHRVSGDAAGQAAVSSVNSEVLIT